MRSLKWALTQYDECPCKQQLGNRHTQRKDCVMTEGENSHLHTKERLPRKPALLTSWSWTPSLQNCEKFNSLFKQRGLFYFAMATPGGSDGKESACNAGDLGSIPGSGRSPGGGHVNPLQYSCLENPHGQRSLTSYSPWGRKESDMTEQLSAHSHTWQP